MDAENNYKSEQRKRWIKNLIFRLLFLIVVVGIVVVIFLLWPRAKAATRVSVVFDPTQVTLGDEQEHLDGAQHFVVDLSQGMSESTQVVNADLSAGSHVVFVYTITNIGPDNVQWSINLNSIENNGFKIRYCLGETDDDGNVHNGTIFDFEPGAPLVRSGMKPAVTDIFWIYFDVEQEQDAAISGSIVLSITLA